MSVLITCIEQNNAYYSFFIIYKVAYDAIDYVDEALEKRYGEAGVPGASERGREA